LPPNECRANGDLASGNDQLGSGIYIRDVIQVTSSPAPSLLGGHLPHNATASVYNRHHALPTARKASHFPL
jgi:hypothetical protein